MINIEIDLIMYIVNRRHLYILVRRDETVNIAIDALRNETVSSLARVVNRTQTTTLEDLRADTHDHSAMLSQPSLPSRLAIKPRVTSRH